MMTLSIHNPTHRAIWGQALGDSISGYLHTRDPLSAWTSISQQRQLPYKRGQLSIYGKQMLGLVDLRLRFPSSSPKEFQEKARVFFESHSGHTLLCRALKDNQPFHLPDLEMAVRIGPLATCFKDSLEMLDTLYGLTKLFSTHPHAIVGSLTFGTQCWNLAQETALSTADLFHFLRNWATKTDIPSETWWVFEQAIRILEQRYPLQEMLDFVNNINQCNKERPPSPRHSLSVLPILFQHNESTVDWTNILQIGGDIELLMNLKGCLLGLQHDIPTWLATSLGHVKKLQSYPIQQVVEAPQQLKLF